MSSSFHPVPVSSLLSSPLWQKGSSAFRRLAGHGSGQTQRAHRSCDSLSPGVTPRPRNTASALPPVTDGGCEVSTAGWTGHPSEAPCYPPERPRQCYEEAGILKQARVAWTTPTKQSGSIASMSIASCASPKSPKPSTDHLLAAVRGTKKDVRNVSLLESSISDVDASRTQSIQQELCASEAGLRNCSVHRGIAEVTHAAPPETSAQRQHRRQHNKRHDKRSRHRGEECPEGSLGVVARADHMHTETPGAKNGGTAERLAKTRTIVLPDDDWLAALAAAATAEEAEQAKHERSQADHAREERAQTPARLKACLPSSVKAKPEGLEIQSMSLDSIDTSLHRTISRGIYESSNRRNSEDDTLAMRKVSAEHLAEMYHMQVQEVKGVEQHFHLLDIKACGQIGPQEFRTLVESRVTVNGLWEPPDTAQLCDVLQWFSKHAFDENLWVPPRQSQIRRFAREWHVHLPEVEEVFKVFDTLDRDKSGAIKLDVFSDLLRILLKVPETMELPQSRVHYFWKEVDRDRDGKIHFEEFFTWFNQNFGTESNPNGPWSKYRGLGSGTRREAATA